MFTAELTREFGRRALVLQTVAAGLSHQNIAVPQRLIYFGEPISAPGYDFHTLAERAAVSQRIEWRFKVPFIGVPLASWGRAPATLTVAPYTNAVWVDGRGWRPEYWYWWVSDS